MICGVLEVENVIQVNDKTRLSAIKSFVTKGNDDIQKVEICPEYIDTDSEFIDVTSPRPADWYLDWLYTGASRAVTVKLRLTTTEADPDAMPTPIEAVYSDFSAAVSVVSVADDMLFSSDQDLMAIEPDISKWVPDGRSSWLNIHRAVQAKIVDWLNKSGIEDSAGHALTKEAIVDTTEVKYWSRDWTLALIYKGIQNASDDVFSEKAKYYFGEAAKGSQRAKLRLDLNDDGEVSIGESVNMVSRDLVRE